jgi:hypothetical protein
MYGENSEVEVPASLAEFRGCSAPISNTFSVPKEFLRVPKKGPLQ